ncbi:MAG: GAK system ATP-grasp enzyme [Desulfosarcinaceae bacterium]|nr:GAK system ATP-grasp enzyme [Desulfosarcinaceae bacterium]
MLKIGVVGTSGGWSSEKLADTVAAKTGYRLLVDMENVAVDLTSGRATFEDTLLNDLDAMIIKKIGAWYSPDLLDRLELLRYLETRGLKFFSSPYAILRVLDRLACTVTLRAHDIPMPPTTVTENVSAALKTLNTYGEAVFKPLYSTKARGMQVIRAGADARAMIAAFQRENRIMYIQQKIDLPGKDLGIVFMGGRYLTTYARCAGETAWNTTTHSGGKYAAHDPEPAVIELARRAQAPFNLDFTCVDVAETDAGPIVFEVSAFGGFKGIITARGIDAAARYADYVMERVS